MKYDSKLHKALMLWNAIGGWIVRHRSCTILVRMLLFLMMCMLCVGCMILYKVFS